jgi:nucleoid-associated protein YgaU
VSKNNPEWPGPTNPALSDTVATAPETAATRPEQYWSVGSGQTLYRIAKSAYGVASLEIIEAIAAANQLDDPGAIRPGQKLLLPLIPGVTAPKGH